METAPILFAFEDHLMRIVVRDGEPWFVAKDVCDVLGLKNLREALSRLDEDERGVADADTIGSDQQVDIISESGLYALILTSRIIEARRFRKWITAEVFPAIRKTGSYAAPVPREPPAPIATMGLSWENATPSDQVALLNAAHRIHGKMAARELWSMLPLPHISGAGPARDLTDREGIEALDAILKAEHNGRAIGNLVAEALEGDASAQSALAPIGILANETADYVTFANATDFMRRLFAGKQKPSLFLVHLTGARPASRKRFGGRQSRGVDIPVATVELLLHGLANEEPLAA